MEENHPRKMEPKQQGGMGELQQRNEHQRGGNKRKRNTLNWTKKSYTKNEENNR